ncbi:MAG: efflux RND transporter periplasmic adaptor subunit [Chthonomonadales bacterium]|nr:efflux RND transporter periplasmic adaptor subunit [Chthonomonadales bacterium]
MRGRWWAGAGAGLALVAGGYWLAGGPAAPPTASAGAQARSEPTAVRASSVAEVVAPAWLEVSGTVRPQLEAALSSKVMGRVVSVAAREGERVRRGQVLVRLETRDLDAAEAQAGANLRAAQAGFGSARVAATMERATTSAQVAGADARVLQAQAALQAATARRQLVQTGPRRQERAQASLAVAQAQAGLALADSNLRRMESLAAEGAISQQQLEATRTAREVARAQHETAVQAESMAAEGSRAEEVREADEAVRQASAALSLARAGLREMEAAALQVAVREQDIQGARARVGQMRAGLEMARATRRYGLISAPFDGVVSARLADPGTMAAPGAPLLRLQGGVLRLEVTVPESALAHVRLGAPAAVAIDALAGRSLPGRVAEIVPQGDPASHTFTVKVAVPGGHGVYAGMFGRARFAVGRSRRIMVPAAAVVEREGLRFAYVVDARGVARMRLVTTGESVGSRVTVLSGLEPGETVVASGLDEVTDGGRVKAAGGL